jgi:hypothetical protein
MPLDELVAILEGHAQQVSDNQQRERAREALDELAVPGRQEPVKRLVGEQPHGVLVLLEALWGDQPHEQGAVVGVGRRIECGQLVAEGQLVAVLLDQLGDVTRSRPSRGTGKPGNGPVTEVHEDHVSASFKTAQASSQPVTIVTSWCFSGVTGHCCRSAS